METKLKKIRADKGLTQRELAEATGISLRTIQHFEQGTKKLNGAAAITVYTLARALDVDIEELLTIPKDLKEGE